MNILKSKLNFDTTLPFWRGFFRVTPAIFAIIIILILAVFYVIRMIHYDNEHSIKNNITDFAYGYVKNNYIKYSYCFSVDNVLILDTVYKRTVLYRDLANIKDSLKGYNSSVNRFSLIYITNLISLTDKDDIAWIDVVLFYHVNLEPSKSTFNKIIYRYIPLDNDNNNYLINSNDRIKI